MWLEGAIDRFAIPRRWFGSLAESPRTMRYIWVAAISCSWRCLVPFGILTGLSLGHRRLIPKQATGQPACIPWEASLFTVVITDSQALTLAPRSWRKPWHLRKSTRFPCTRTCAHLYAGFNASPTTRVLPKDVSVGSFFIPEIRATNEFSGGPIWRSYCLLASTVASCLSLRRPKGFFCRGFPSLADRLFEQMIPYWADHSLCCQFMPTGRRHIVRCAN